MNNRFERPQELTPAPDYKTNSFGADARDPEAYDKSKEHVFRHLEEMDVIEAEMDMIRDQWKKALEEWKRVMDEIKSNVKRIDELMIEIKRERPAEGSPEKQDELFSKQVEVIKAYMEKTKRLLDYRNNIDRDMEQFRKNSMELETKLAATIASMDGGIPSKN